MTLYEIDKAIQDAYEAGIDPETGEVVDDVAFAMIDQLQMDRNTKIENIVCWIKDLKAEAAAIKAEADNLSKRMKTSNNRAESLKRYLGYVLAGEKFKSPKGDVSFRKSVSTEVDPEAIAVLPEEFLTFEDPKPNKTAIKKALQEGEELPGCRLVENTSIIIK
jgi:hypothetical protein